LSLRLLSGIPRQTECPCPVTIALGVKWSRPLETVEWATDGAVDLGVAYVIRRPPSRTRLQDQSHLDLYFSESGETPLLSADEERRLARRVAKGDSAARDHLIRANLRLVI